MLPGAQSAALAQLDLHPLALQAYVSQLVAGGAAGQVVEAAVQSEAGVNDEPLHFAGAQVVPAG